jgi:hypothetical protein
MKKIVLIFIANMLLTSLKAQNSERNKVNSFVMNLVESENVFQKIGAILGIRDSITTQNITLKDAYKFLIVNKKDLSGSMLNEKKLIAEGNNLIRIETKKGQLIEFITENTNKTLSQTHTRVNSYCLGEITYLNVSEKQGKGGCSFTKMLYPNDRDSTVRIDPNLAIIIGPIPVNNDPYPWDISVITSETIFKTISRNNNVNVERKWIEEKNLRDYSINHLNPKIKIFDNEQIIKSIQIGKFKINKMNKTIVSMQPTSVKIK